jgi:lipoprotein-releasing system ATP-binding protein
MILEAKDIKKSYEIAGQKTTQVLKGVNLNINDGDFVALMGRSGAGKSTLLHILGSLDSCDSGDIILNVDGDIFDYTKMNTYEFTMLRNKHIGFVFQFHHLLPEFSAIENVMMPALIAGESFSNAKDKAMRLLEKVGLVQQIEQKPSELSGGEQQRTAIARALINDPSIIFADEPTGNLDKFNSDSILELIKDLKEQFGKTFIIATHSPDVASIAERVLQMNDGKII